MTGQEQARLAVRLSNLLFALCRINNVQAEISEVRALEVVTQFHKDLQKLEYHQGDDISVNKRIAGLSFWVRRVKPIVFAAKVNDNREICDINEQVAVWMSHELLLFYCDSPHAGKAMQSLPFKSRREPFEEFLCHYWTLSDAFNYTSLVYMLRYRNVSPHHMALLLDAITSAFILKHTQFR